MDAVYVVRSGNNEELRFSLRSIAENLAHSRVVIVGRAPEWLTGVTRIPAQPRGSRYANSTAGLLAACRAGVSERFVFLNDDMYVMAPMYEVPTVHLGPIETVANRHRPYSLKMRALAEWLRERGHVEPLCYEAHTPMVLERRKVIEALALDIPRTVRDAHKRSLYGNHFRIGGEQMPDCKVETGPWPDGPFLSTTDRSFRDANVGAFIRASFPSPGPYEQ